MNNNYAGLFDVKSSVTDRALEGWVKANTGLVLLAGHRTVLRRDYRSIKHVRLLSGCWSGYEPMPIGFVGPGMLTGAVVGERCYAPPYPTILAAIRELDSVHGVLVIVMNHPSLRVNFSLAVDIAKRENIHVEVIFVCDNCCNQTGQHGRRGSAGTTMLFKIAGAMAENNRTLEEIYRTCLEISTSHLSTVSVNVLNEKRSAVFKSAENLMFSMDEISGFETGESIEELKKLIQIRADGEEPGEGTVHKFINIDDVIYILIGYLIDGTVSSHHLVVEPDRSIALLFNNYGSILNLELNALVREFSMAVEDRGIKINSIYIGSLITNSSLSFSITAMKVTDEIAQHLEYPTAVSRWPSNVLFSAGTGTSERYIKGQHHFTLEQEVKLLGPILTDLQAERIYRTVEYVILALISCEEQINKMGQNSNSPLYGTSVKTGAEMISRYLYDNKLRTNCPYAFLKQLSVIAGTYIQDLAGSCYAVFFEGASQAFLPYFNQSPMTEDMWSDALEKGIKAIEFFTKMKRGKRTMLDALYPALETMKQSPETFTEIAEAAELGSINTVDRINKLPDPGSHTVGIWVRAAVEGLNSFHQQEPDAAASLSDFSDISTDISLA